MTLTIGADPELFLKENDRYISAHGVIPGTKAKPHMVDYGAVQVDGLALEFNIAPAIRVKDFVGNIDAVLSTLRDMIPSGTQAVIEATAEFEDGYIDSLPKATRELGCDPDFNAYTMEANNPPPAHPTMRTAAGHVHIGWGDEVGISDNSDYHFFDCSQYVKQLDYYLGLPSIILDPHNNRREMYGQAGTFRPKPYGVEYRVLSNFWLKSTALKEWVFNTSLKAFDELVHKGHNLYDTYGDTARDVINSGDVETATSLCKRMGIQYEC